MKVVRECGQASSESRGSKSAHVHGIISCHLLVPLRLSGAKPELGCGGEGLLLTLLLLLCHAAPPYCSPLPLASAQCGCAHRAPARPRRLQLVTRCHALLLPQDPAGSSVPAQEISKRAEQVIAISCENDASIRTTAAAAAKAEAHAQAIAQVGAAVGMHGQLESCTRHCCIRSSTPPAC